MQGFCNLKTGILHEAYTSAAKDEDPLLACTLHCSATAGLFPGHSHPFISPQQTLTEIFKHPPSQVSTSAKAVLLQHNLMLKRWHVPGAQEAVLHIIVTFLRSIIL